LLGVNAEEIDDVILIHLHYHYPGNINKIPRARFHIQDDEVDYATSSCMCYPITRQTYYMDNVVELVRYFYTERVEFQNRYDEVASGIDLLCIGGHAKGLQAVRVHNSRGWVGLGCACI